MKREEGEGGVGIGLECSRKAEWGIEREVVYK